MFESEIFKAGQNPQNFSPSKILGYTVSIHKITNIFGTNNSWPKVLGSRVRNHYRQDFKLMAFSTAWEETHTSRISGSINGTQLCVHCENCQTVKSKSLSNKPCTYASGWFIHRNM